MQNLKNVLLTFVLLLSIAAIAQDTDPLWLRYPSISPDGSQIAFTYKGDIYLVPTSGGIAMPITIDPGHESMPVWSNDGNQLAYVSDTYGNLDVFIVNAMGGTSKRLTFHSSDDYPSAFSADGKAVMFSSRRLDMNSYAQFPNGRMPELYQVPSAGGRPEMLLTTPAEDAIVTKGGSKIYYQDKKGYEDPWRKHHNSSITRDIWVFDQSTQKHKKLTEFGGEDREPALSPDEQTLYYLSEESGSYNVHSIDLATGASQQMTEFSKHPVRFLSIASSGLLSFSFDGEIYTMKGNQTPVKLSVEIFGMRQIQARQTVPISGGITEMALSPNGKEVAVVVRGEVFVASMEDGLTKRITNTPSQERSVSFSPDGRSLVYAAERGSSWDVYQSTIKRSEEKYFYASTVLEEKAIIATAQEEFQPAYSPDGKKVAFLEERTTLRVYDLATEATQTIVAGDKNYSYSDGDQYYQWSPDSKWFLVSFLIENHWISDVGIVPATGGELRDLTLSGYDDGEPQWMMDGKMMIWYSNRDGMKNHASWGSENDVYGMFFTQEAFDRYRLSESDFKLLEEKEKEIEEKETPTDSKSKKGNEVEEESVIDIQWSGLEKRKVKLSIHSSRLSGAVVTEDGSEMYYLARFEKGIDLWMTNLRTSETKILSKLKANSAGSLSLTEDGKHIVLLADGKVFSVDTKSGEKKSVSVKGEMELKKADEMAYIYEHAWRQVQKKFYVKDLHGVDWDFYKREYAKFLPHIDNNWEFSELLSELLGELNASHTGCRYSPDQENMDVTASLGLFLDESGMETGLKITEVLKGGPFDRADSKAKSGVIVEAIDGVTINPSVNHYALLNRKVGNNMLVSMYNPSTKDRWQEVIKPISRGAEYNLLYDRWVDNRRKEVEDASGGKIGYVHVRGMNDNSFRTVFEEVLGRNANKESIVLDTRSNGGGWLHDDLATFLSGIKYIEMVPRGQRIGFEPQRKWTKPTALLMGESNYSDAHMFPYAYKVQNLGKMVGMPVPGTGTAVWWERQIDPTLVFGIPQVGMLDVDGDFLENKQLEPDVKVKNSYEKLSKGEDEQLRTAVKLLLEPKKPSDTKLERVEGN
jgi:tricorn protease